VKNPPTLADECIATALDKGDGGVGGPGERRRVVREFLLEISKARKFVLDPAMSRFTAELGHSFWKGGQRKRNAMLDNVRQFARAPHAPLTWIEFDHLAYIARIKELGAQGVGGLTGDPPRMGWLIRQHPKNDVAFICNEVRSALNHPGRAFLHPLAMAWCSDDNPSPWSRFLETELTGEHEAQVMVGMGGYQSTQVHWHANLGEAFTVSMMNMMAGPAGSDQDKRIAALPALTIRVLWALLATINDLPVTIQNVQPTKGYVARGSYKKFLAHSIVHLTVPETQFRRLISKATTILRRRAHQVRGHWRRDWRNPLRPRCEHVFDGQMICHHCGGRQLWIPEHQRGDASLGFVTHDYSVEHKNA
jgi:hypothetical protein